MGAYPAAVGVEQPGDDAQQRRLAATGAPDQRDGLAGVDVQVHVGEHVAPVEGLAHAIERDGARDVAAHAPQSIVAALMSGISSMKPKSTYSLACASSIARPSASIGRIFGTSKCETWSATSSEAPNCR